MADTAKQKTIEQVNQGFPYLTGRVAGEEGRPGVYFQELTMNDDGQPTGWNEEATNAAYQEWLTVNPEYANTAGEGENVEEENGGEA